jgi:lipopolysaccharide export system protein LptA
MKRFVFQSILTYLLPVLILSYPAKALSETPPQDISNDAAKTSQIQVSSDTLEIDNKLNLVTFTGNVYAKRDAFTINCEKMFIHYKKIEGKTDPQNTNSGIEKIIATGEVKISRSDGSLAMADKAVYYQDNDELVLTGKPVVKQGDDFVEGSSITLFIKENRSIVKDAKAVLYSKTEEGNPLDR